MAFLISSASFSPGVVMTLPHVGRMIGKNPCLCPIVIVDSRKTGRRHPQTGINDIENR
jgi:hypothetical protein